MAYKRIDTQNGTTRMTKELYDNLQDGIEEAMTMGGGGSVTFDDTDYGEDEDWEGQ